MNPKRRISKATFICRHLLRSGKFYYNIYQGQDGIYFSDPETFNCEDLTELKININNKKNISMTGGEHFKRMQECQSNQIKLQQIKDNPNVEPITKTKRR